MGRQIASDDSGRTTRLAARVLFIAVCYFLANRLALIFPDSQKVLAALWPAGGIGLAALLLTPRRQWPVILAGIFVAGNAANLVVGRPFTLSIGFMTANIVESLACAWLILHWCGPEVRFTRVREVLALVAAAVCVNAGSALIGAGTAALSGLTPFGDLWLRWWIEDGLGILLIAPLIVTWSDFRDLFHDLRWPRVLESLLLMLVLAAAAWAAFHPNYSPRSLSPRPYMVIGVLAWCGLRFGQRTVTLVLVVLAALAITTKAVNLEPFLAIQETPEDRLLTIQIYLAVVGSSGLLLAAAYAEAKSAGAQLCAIGDNLPDGAVYQLLRERDGSKRFLYFSAGIEKLTGIPTDEILRDYGAYYSLLLDEDRPAYAAAEQEAIRNWTPFREAYRVRRRDGEVRWIQANSSPRHFGEGRIVWDGILTDVTQRKQSEDDLRTSEARFRTLIEDAPIAIAVSQNQRLIYASPTLARMYGFEDRSSMYARSIFEFFAPHTRTELEQRSLRRRQGFPEPKEYQTVALRQDGSEFPILLNLVPMQFPEGQVMVSFITDLTAARQSEEERSKLEQQLRQAQKLESIGRLAGGVAHDFNNLLTVINGFSTLLTQKLDNQSRLWSYADQVRKSGERGASLTRQLLAFSRQEAIKPVHLNLNRIIADSAPMVRSLMGEDIALSARLDPGVGQVLADKAQIDQVILNLAANARDAMPHGGRLEIATRNADTHRDEKAERWVVVTVTDTGVGMDEATRQHIFEPFFTTKGVGKGTGLGLATVYGVMQQNGGWIDVQSTAGSGTSFDLYFPCIEDQVTVPASTEAAAPDQVHGGERILLVEDDAAVRDFLRSVLEDHGYHVVEALDGKDALEIARKQRHPIHLLITDVVMPGMNGKELSERLRQERPGLKVIFLSGYSTDVIGHRGVLERDVAFLQKPVSPEILAAKVHDVLNGTAV
jgi:PAS domain S-box-containing protein